MMSDNTYGREQVGAVKEGSALLAGILRCRRCGRKLMVRYTGKRHDVLRYACYRAWLDNGLPPCIGFSGLSVDEVIAREILRVVQPAAIEAAVMAAEEQTSRTTKYCRRGNENGRQHATPRTVRRNNMI